MFIIPLRENWFAAKVHWINETTLLTTWTQQKSFIELQQKCFNSYQLNNASKQMCKVCKCTRIVQEMQPECYLPLSKAIALGIKETWHLLVLLVIALNRWPASNSSNSLWSGWSWLSNIVLAFLRTCLSCTKACHDSSQKSLTRLVSLFLLARFKFPNHTVIQNVRTDSIKLLWKRVIVSVETLKEWIFLRKKYLLNLLRGSVNMGFKTQFAIKNNIQIFVAIHKVNINTFYSSSWQWAYLWLSIINAHVFSFWHI